MILVSVWLSGNREGDRTLSHERAFANLQNAMAFVVETNKRDPKAHAELRELPLAEVYAGVIALHRDAQNAGLGSCSLAGNYKHPRELASRIKEIALRAKSMPRRSKTASMESVEHRATRLQTLLETMEA